MKLRTRLTLYYSLTFSLFIGVALLVIYLLSAQYRRDEFYQRLEDRTLTTFKLLLEVEHIDHDLLQAMDRNTINSLYEEKIILFDSTGRIIYSSIDDTKVFYASDIINELKSGQTDEIKKAEGDYEILGINFVEKNHSYFGIAKAYDRYGKTKLYYLGWLLLSIFLGSIFAVWALSYYVSKIITVPVSRLSQEMEDITPQKLSERINEPGTGDEISFLAHKFNELLERLEQAFGFQSHFIHHISHELKTPLAVLVSNVERMQHDSNPEQWHQSLEFQKNGLREISNIINALLDISKTETGAAHIAKERIRLDELIFECIEELSAGRSYIRFEFAVSPLITHSADMEINGSTRMMKIALTNLLKNAVQYAESFPVDVFIHKEGPQLITEISNNGTLLNEDEVPLLFHHFFRGSNAANTKGFGLGLVLISKIVSLHGGSIFYSIKDNSNNFTLTLPLAV